MPRTRIKICGITRPCDAERAVAAGADAIGLVFYTDSPRAVEIETARKVAAAIPPFVTLVGLFVDPQEAFVRTVCKDLPLGLLQFHGAEPEAFCRQFDVPWMKAIRVAAETDVGEQIRQWPSASAILLDAYRKGKPGGTGKTFNWEQVPRRVAMPLVLAGGLNGDNVEAAIRMTRPFAVDVSGGVESAPGIKDAEKIEQFASAVRAADRE